MPWLNGPVETGGGEIRIPKALPVAGRLPVVERVLRMMSLLGEERYLEVIGGVLHLLRAGAVYTFDRNVAECFPIG